MSSGSLPPRPDSSPLSALHERLAALESHLESAAADEHIFAHDVHKALAALESFIDAHRADDEHLTRLVQEDTQRSLDARDEYNMLSATFDDALQPNRSTRWREFVGVASLYISIALSVVFMAPLHFLMSMFDGGLRRLGYYRVDEGGRAREFKGTRPRSSLRNPDRAREAKEKPPSRHKRRLSSAKARVPADGVPPPKKRAPSPEMPSPPSREASGSEGRWPNAEESGAEEVGTPGTMSEEGLTLRREPQLSGSGGAPNGGGSSRSSVRAESVGTVGGGDGIVLSLGGGNAEGNEDGSHSSAAAEGDDSDGGDGLERCDSRVRNAGESGDESDNNHGHMSDEHESETEGDGEFDLMSEDGEVDENEGGRPAWARPFCKDDTSTDQVNFPTADFWNISDDDFKIEALKRNG